LALFLRGFGAVAGVDEAGRGPLAGPVVAACVILEKKSQIPQFLRSGVRDSKLLSAKKRKDLSRVIMDHYRFGIGICDSQTIDRINILQATFLAMRQAITACAHHDIPVLVDGNRLIPNLANTQQTIIRGDRTVFTVAMASIIAKEHRDRIMREMHELYPRYRFDRNAGYGTGFHLEQIRNHGLCPIHRRSFKPCSEVV
jgi:ribonuclease HII